MEEMNEYLKPSRLCDCDNAEIREKAVEITGEVEGPREAALRIFYFVRDEIPFGFGLYDPFEETASRTLRRDYGDCGSKTNLQVALLRARGIPARYHFARAKGEILKPSFPRFISDRFPTDMWHLWCECYLSGKWIACEALLDEPLYKGMLREGLITREQIPVTDWDGETDLVVLGSWIVRDIGVSPYCEEFLEELVKRGYVKKGLPPRILLKLFGWFPYSLPNERMNRIRKGGKKGFVG
ncbi:MAG: hypothetical protein DRI61_13955 [Chloroflexi bacterium]|nr:MAG: hypothetical protein DRI61_13955 [Chloroflexota bacterium]